jgi:UDP-N-acetylmuramate--alanine ligase
VYPTSPVGSTYTAIAIETSCFLEYAYENVMRHGLTVDANRDERGQKFPCKRIGNLKKETDQPMDTNNCPTAHLVGVCGSGMRALAEVLMDRGWSLSGSDLTPPNASIEKLTERGLVFHLGHSQTNVPPATQQLIYSPAIPAENVERIFALGRSLPQRSYSQAVGQLMKHSTGVCVAGTHGKSTTTAMVASILEESRRLSAVVMGAELCDGGRSGWSGPGDLFVAESCEFKQSFLDLNPGYSTILAVEPDHFDCYADLESLQEAFCDFASKTASNGVLMVNWDCPVSRQVSVRAQTDAKRVSFGMNHTADWQAADLEQTKNGTRFKLTYQRKPVIEIDLPIHGEHNVWNGLAAAALCGEIGVSPETIRNSLSKFHGIRRRFEFVGESGGVTFFDDYAHHPTAVRITLKTLRKVMGTRRIRCVFQPHQIRRTTALMTDFASSFVDADEVFLAPVFAARESVADEPAVVSRELADRIASHGVPAQFFSSLDQIVDTLEDAMRPGDVIVTMGAGDIDRIHHEFTRRI